MLQDTLLKIETNTNLKSLNQLTRQKLIKVLSTFKIGNVIYPRMIVRLTGLTLKEAYLLLDQIESIKIIEKAYEIQCSRCHHYTNEIYYSLNEIPLEIFCENCENEIDFMKSIIIVYRVINE